MSRPAARPVFRTLASSMLMAGFALGIWGFAPPEFPRTHLTLIGLGFFAAFGAVAIGRYANLGTAWLILTFIATPALVLVPIYQPPIWVFPAIVLLLAGFYINGVREQVPLYLSNRRTQDSVAAIFERTNGSTFIDLGCGLGDIVSAVASKAPNAHVIGVETAPLSYLIAIIRIIITGHRNAAVRFESIWNTDISDADVVYAFLSPAPMARLYEKLKAEMKPGSCFVSNSFAVPGDEPDEIIAVDDSRQTQLLIWNM